MGYRLVHLAALSIAGRTHDNRSHAASEGRYRGSDLAVTAGELNAGSGVGRLGAVLILQATESLDEAMVGGVTAGRIGRSAVGRRDQQ